jgi:hypothetical protein
MAAHLIEKGLHDVVMGARPYGASPNAPKIDDVADQIDCLRLVGLEKLAQRVGPARARCKMHI